MYTLDTFGEHADGVLPAVGLDWQQHADFTEELSATLSTTRVQAPLAPVAHALTGEGHDASEDGTGRGTPLVFDWQSGGDVRLNISEDGSSALQASQVPALMQGMAVRRLTPLEGCRLQGFPDDWLDIDGLSDSARYRLLGNAVAVPVGEWIARRMMAVL